MSDGLTKARVIDGALSRYAEWSEHGYEEPSNGYQKLLEGKKNNFQSLIGNTLHVPFIGDVELIAVNFTEPVSREMWPEYDAPFHQGYEGQGFIVIKVDGTYYKKPANQDSYGSINFDMVVDSWDEERYALVPATKVQKTIDVWG